MVTDTASLRRRENLKTHKMLKPEDCNCTGDFNCNICDGGLAFCTVCKGGEAELEDQSCEERMTTQRAAEKQG